MRFCINSKSFLITYCVICGSESWTSEKIVFANNSSEARSIFNSNRGHFCKIVNVEEQSYSEGVW